MLKENDGGGDGEVERGGECHTLEMENATFFCRAYF